MTTHDIRFEMLIIKMQDRGFRITHEYRNYLFNQITQRTLVRNALYKYYGV